MERRRGTEDEGNKSEDTNMELQLVKSFHNIEEGGYLRKYEQTFLPQDSKDLLIVTSGKAEIHDHSEWLDNESIHTI